MFKVGDIVTPRPEWLDKGEPLGDKYVVVSVFSEGKGITVQSIEYNKVWTIGLPQHDVRADTMMLA